MSLTAIVGYYWAFVAVVWILCKLRLLPVPVMRVWFTAVIIGQILLMGALTFLADKLRVVGVPRSTTEWLCCMVCSWTFWAVGFFNPQIRVTLDESEQKWSEIPPQSAVALNHTSFWDAFLFIGTAPWVYIENCRTLMKSSLRNIPIFGGVFDRVGHFPVYFKSDEDGNFSVDKERQSPVMDKVKFHLNKGGRIALFPEGAVNKTPEVLRPFRHGSFAIIIEQKLPLYYFLMVGNNDTWPAAAGIGGYPADIYCSMHHYPIDFTREDLTAKEIAAGLEKAMQEKLDHLLALQSKHKAKQ